MPDTWSRYHALVVALEKKYGAAPGLAAHAIRMQKAGLLDNEPGFEKRVRAREAALLKRYGPPRAQ